VEIEIVTNQPTISAGIEDDEPSKIEPVEYKTVNVFEKFREYIYELEDEGHRIEKVTISNKLYRMLKQSDEYYKHRSYHTVEEKRLEMLFGIHIEHEHFGHESIVDFLIYTDKKVFHSDMLDKEFLEDVNVEELLHEANNRIEDRENDS